MMKRRIFGGLLVAALVGAVIRRLLGTHDDSREKTTVKLSSLFSSEEMVRETALMALLIEHPELADEFDLSKFDMTALCVLLKARPELVTKCDLSKLNVQGAADLIIEVPAAADNYDLTRFGGEQWETVLLAHPELADRLEKYGKDLQEDEISEFWLWLNRDEALRGERHAKHLKKVLRAHAEAGGAVSRRILDFVKESSDQKEIKR